MLLIRQQLTSHLVGVKATELPTRLAPCDLIDTQIPSLRRQHAKLMHPKLSTSQIILGGSCKLCYCKPSKDKQSIANCVKASLLAYLRPNNYAVVLPDIILLPFLNHSRFGITEAPNQKCLLNRPLMAKTPSHLIYLASTIQ